MERKKGGGVWEMFFFFMGLETIYLIQKKLPDPHQVRKWLIPSGSATMKSLKETDVFDSKGYRKGANLLTIMCILKFQIVTHYEYKAELCIRLQNITEY